MDQIYSENRIFFKETELTHHQKYKLELHKLLNLSRSRPRSRSMAQKKKKKILNKIEMFC